MFTPHPPEKGYNAEEEVEIVWHDGTVTASRVKWYGKGTRSEYRLTRFGKAFPFHNPDVVGDLVVLVPKDHWHFEAFVLDQEDDIEEIQAALGVEPFERWGVYQTGAPKIEDESECLERKFREFVLPLAKFPTGAVFSEVARAYVNNCVALRKNATMDFNFMRWMEVEYQLFQRAERQICQKEIARTFKDVDDFLKTARSIGNRRMSRAGRSLENHVDHVLNLAGVPHDVRPTLPGHPDIVIPSANAYLDSSYPHEKLCVIGVKTTCKDRWRQVLHEAPRVKNKHILTLQQGISSKQLTSMEEAGVTLIVPQKLQKLYPKHPIPLLTIEQFIANVKHQIS
jgi:type II restriction enzyme